MSMHRVCKTCIGVFFLLTFLFLVLVPASTAGNSNSGNNKYKQKITVDKKTSKQNDSVKKILAYYKGPKINNPGEGVYKMKWGNNKDKWKYRYFKKGHPQNPHRWRWHWRWCYHK